MGYFILDHVQIPEDIDFLYEAMTGEEQYLYSTTLHFNSRRNFENWLCSRLRHEFHDFYLLRDTRMGKPLGYVHNYDFSLTDGHCKLVVYIIPEHRETGLGGLAAISFMKKLFLQYPLRKLYSTVYEYNRESLRSNLAAGFQDEGTLKDYRYHDGTYHGIHYLSISREQFECTLGKKVR